MIETRIGNGGFPRLAVWGAADGIQECVFNGIFNDRVVCDAIPGLDQPYRNTGKEEVIAECGVVSEAPHPVFTNRIGYNGGEGEARLDDFNIFHKAVDIQKGSLGKSEPTEYIDEGQRLGMKDNDGVL